MDSADLQRFEERLNYTFRDKTLLVRALTHKSFSSETRPTEYQPDNEQLEFFGDSILGFLVSELLVANYPQLPEGKLSRAKSFLVSARWLQTVARSLDLGDFLQLGRGEVKGGGRDKPSLLANAFEAVLAALYIDGGMEIARGFVQEHVYRTDPFVGDIEGVHTNYKGELWEKASIEKLGRPEYRVVQTSGPAHAPLFTVEARLGKSFKGTGEGSSRKVAEQSAARSLLLAMAPPSDAEAAGADE